MFEGELDTKGYKQQVWLVKVPKKVSEVWNSQNSDELAKMKIIGDKVSIDLKDGTEYKLDMSKSAPLYVFSDQEKKNMTLEGKVEQLCIMVCYHFFFLNFEKKKNGFENDLFFWVCFESCLIDLWRVSR